MDTKSYHKGHNDFLNQTIPLAGSFPRVSVSPCLKQYFYLSLGSFLFVLFLLCNVFVYAAKPENLTFEAEKAKLAGGAAIQADRAASGGQIVKWKFRSTVKPKPLLIYQQQVNASRNNWLLKKQAWPSVNMS